jgi:hypothetical protein
MREGREIRNGKVPVGTIRIPAECAPTRGHIITGSRILAALRENGTNRAFGDSSTRTAATTLFILRGGVGSGKKTRDKNGIL